MPEGYLRELIDYWQHGFDWRAQERHFNSFPHFKITIEGLGIHFVHIPGQGKDPLPLLLVHGWPSTFHEMLRLGEILADPMRQDGERQDGARGGPATSLRSVQALSAATGTDPQRSFSVVIPSLPGHGYSDRQPPGFADRDAARILAKLMRRLDYKCFGVHAYDLGASISGLMCLDDPDAVIGYHTTSPGNPQPYLGSGSKSLTEAESSFLEIKKRWYIEEGGYAHLLGTRPDTVGYALNDSPVGLAAWIIEKWYAWTAPPSGNLEEHFTKDELLTNVTIYWLTQTILSANRYYHEAVRWPGLGEAARTPHGVALTATQPFERPPREFVERLFPDIRRWIELPRGGHFVALEDPISLAQAIRGFFGELR